MKIIFSFIILLWSAQSFSQEKSDFNNVYVEQVVLPGLNAVYKYHCYEKGNSGDYYLEIWKKTDKYFESRNKTIDKIIFKTKLKEDEIIELNKALLEANIYNLKSSYSKPVLDGTVFNFDFYTENDHSESTTLDNFYLAELNYIVETLNSFLPEKRRYLSMVDLKR